MSSSVGEILASALLSLQEKREISPRVVKALMRQLQSLEAAEHQEASKQVKASIPVVMTIVMTVVMIILITCRDGYHEDMS